MSIQGGAISVHLEQGRILVRPDVGPEWALSPAVALSLAAALNKAVAMQLAQDHPEPQPLPDPRLRPFTIIRGGK